MVTTGTDNMASTVDRFAANTTANRLSRVVGQKAGFCRGPVESSMDQLNAKGIVDDRGLILSGDGISAARRERPGRHQIHRLKGVHGDHDEPGTEVGHQRLGSRSSRHRHVRVPPDGRYRSLSPWSQHGTRFSGWDADRGPMSRTASDSRS